MIVALLMGVAGSLVQYFLPPDSEVTANIVPSIPFAFVVISLIVNIIRTGRVNEEEGVGGALDRAITPNGGSRLAASADTENLYPKLNFYFPVVVFGAPAFCRSSSSRSGWALHDGVCVAVIFLPYARHRRGRHALALPDHVRRRGRPRHRPVRDRARLAHPARRGRGRC